MTQITGKGTYFVYNSFPLWKILNNMTQIITTMTICAYNQTEHGYHFLKIHVMYF